MTSSPRAELPLNVRDFQNTPSLSLHNEPSSLKDPLPMTTERLRILVPTAGILPVQETANAIVHVARRLNADLIPLHIVMDGENEAEAIQGPQVLADAARSAGVSSFPTTRHGELISSIIATAEEFQVNLILMGASDGTIVQEWLSADVMNRCRIPVVVIPHSARNG